MTNYVRKDVLEITGLPPRLLQFYINEKITIPRIIAGTGRGNRYEYFKHNILDLLIVKELSDIGIKIGNLKDVLAKYKAAVKFYRDQNKSVPKYLCIINSAENQLLATFVDSLSDEIEAYVSRTIIVLNYQTLLAKIEKI